MYRKRSPHPLLWVILLIATLFMILSYTIASAKTSDTEVSARAAVLYEPETGSFLFTKNESQRLPMASTTKVMTALVAAESCELSETVKVDGRAVGTEGSSAYLTEGELLTMEELLYALLLQSANDAACAIALHISGSIEDFAALMNEKVSEMGLSDTHFTNPHGLDDKDHYTTARELALIAAEALKNETVKKIASTYKYTSKSGARVRTYVNHNKLLKSYDGAIGLKTGFTKKCGRCLVGAAERDGLSFITVTLNAGDDWNDHRKLFDLGFSTMEKIYLARKGEFAYSLPIIGGKSDTLELSNTDELSIIVKKGEHIVESFPKVHRYLAAPVRSTDILGAVYFTLDGENVGSVRLYPESEVDKKEEKGFFKRIFNR